jgi:hypothetical protein
MYSFVLEARDDESVGDCFWNRKAVLPSRSDLEVEVERDLQVPVRAALSGVNAALERRRRHCIMMTIVMDGELNFISELDYLY